MDAGWTTRSDVYMEIRNQDLPESQKRRLGTAIGRARSP
jgi:hypothetical protein